MAIVRIEDDRSEMKDLSGKFPEVVNKMEVMWGKLTNRLNVHLMPWKEENQMSNPFIYQLQWNFLIFDRWVWE